MKVLKQHNLDNPIVEANGQLIVEFENRIKNQFYLVQHFHGLHQAPDLLQHIKDQGVRSTSAVEDIFSRRNATYTSHRFWSELQYYTGSVFLFNLVTILSTANVITENLSMLYLLINQFFFFISKFT